MTSGEENSSLWRIARFAVVGGSGILVNEGMLIVLHGSVGWPLLLSSIIAIELSILSNFILNSLWTWKYDFRGSFARVLRSCIRYHAVTGLSTLVANVLLLMLLVRVFEVDYRLANLAGIMVASAINFLGMEFWVFRKS